MIDQETETIEYLDFDYEIECEGLLCARTAEFIVKMFCCGAEIFICEPCLEAEHSLVESQPDRSCARCHESFGLKTVPEIWDERRL